MRPDHGAERETVRMKFEEKLKKRQYDQMWSEYCGFLDLDIDGYMRIQTRLMEEQIALWSGSAWGGGSWMTSIRGPSRNSAGPSS